MKLLRMIGSGLKATFFWALKVGGLILGTWLAIAFLAATLMWALTPLNPFAWTSFVATFSLWNQVDAQFDFKATAIAVSAGIAMFCTGVGFLRYGHQVGMPKVPLRGKGETEEAVADDDADYFEDDAAPAGEAPENPGSRAAIAGATPGEKKAHAETKDQTMLTGTKANATNPAEEAEEEEVEEGSGEVYDEAQDEPGEEDRGEVDLRIPGPLQRIMSLIRDPFKKAPKMLFWREPEIQIEQAESVVRRTRGKVLAVSEKLRQHSEALAEHNPELDAEVDQEDVDGEAQQIIEEMMGYVGQYQMGARMRSAQLLKKMRAVGRRAYVEASAALADTIHRGMLDRVGTARLVEIETIYRALLDEADSGTGDGTGDGTGEGAGDVAAEADEAYAASAEGDGEEQGDEDPSADARMTDFTADDDLSAMGVGGASPSPQETPQVDGEPAGQSDEGATAGLNLSLDLGGMDVASAGMPDTPAATPAATPAVSQATQPAALVPAEAALAPAAAIVAAAVEATASRPALDASTVPGMTPALAKMLSKVGEGGDTKLIQPKELEALAEKIDQTFREAGLGSEHRNGFQAQLELLGLTWDTADYLLNQSCYASEVLSVTMWHFETIVAMLDATIEGAHAAQAKQAAQPEAPETEAPHPETPETDSGETALAAANLDLPADLQVATNDEAPAQTDTAPAADDGAEGDANSDMEQTMELPPNTPLPPQASEFPALPVLKPVAAPAAQPVQTQPVQTQPAQDKQAHAQPVQVSEFPALPRLERVQPRPVMTLADASSLPFPPREKPHNDGRTAYAREDALGYLRQVLMWMDFVYDQPADMPNVVSKTVLDAQAEHEMTAAHVYRTDQPTFGTWLKLIRVSYLHLELQAESLTRAGLARFEALDAEKAALLAAQAANAAAEAQPANVAAEAQAANAAQDASTAPDALTTKPAGSAVLPAGTSTEAILEAFKAKGVDMTIEDLRAIPAFAEVIDSEDAALRSVIFSKVEEALGALSAAKRARYEPIVAAALATSRPPAAQAKTVEQAPQAPVPPPAPVLQQAQTAATPAVVAPAVVAPVAVEPVAAVPTLAEPAAVIPAAIASAPQAPAPVEASSVEAAPVEVAPVEVAPVAVPVTAPMVVAGPTQHEQTLELTRTLMSGFTDAMERLVSRLAPVQAVSPLSLGSAPHAPAVANAAPAGQTGAATNDDAAVVEGDVKEGEAEGKQGEGAETVRLPERPQFVVDQQAKLEQAIMTRIKRRLLQMPGFDVTFRPVLVGGGQLKGAADAFHVQAIRYVTIDGRDRSQLLMIQIVHEPATEWMTANIMLDEEHTSRVELRLDGIDPSGKPRHLEIGRHALALTRQRYAKLLAPHLTPDQALSLDGESVRLLVLTIQDNGEIKVRGPADEAERARGLMFYDAKSEDIETAIEAVVFEMVQATNRQATQNSAA